MSGVHVRPVEPSDARALSELFVREGSPCFCRFWHFSGTNKEWEARCALDQQKSRAELEAAVTQRADEGRGLVAQLQAHEAIIGWTKLVPQRTLPKLLARVPYRGLKTPPAGSVFSLACFLVDPRHRRQGVARALVEGAMEWAPRFGATVLEVYPRVSEPMHPEEMWTGPRSIFEKLGFEVFRESPQYPVYRKRLTAAAG